MQFFISFFFISISFYLSSCQLLQGHHQKRPPKPEESIELTPPLPTANLPAPPPECTLPLLHRSFCQTAGCPPVTVPYSPPLECPSPWSHVVLHLSGSVSGIQSYRIAAVWLGGAEVLRTSTPEPFNAGTFWNVKKDITRYSSLLQRSNIFLSMMLENIANEEFTGVHHVNLTVLFYQHNKTVINDDCLSSGLGAIGSGGYRGVVSYEHPADLVIPVTEKGNAGLWFRIQDESPLVSKNVVIPANARRIVLELYLSFHGDDEFWYSNPPNGYIEANNLTTSQGNGAFREVYVKVDGHYVASEIPFPVVFPGGINPLFWKPVVAIGAFNMPSYDFDLTPFLGSLTDGKKHRFEVGVAHATRFWLVGGNLHVWLERESRKVEAGMSIYLPPQFLETSEFNFKLLDGLFQTEAQRSSVSSGWVSVSCGNLTTTIARRINFRNSIMLQNNGAYKTVKQQVKVKTQVRVMSDTGVMVARRKFKRKTALSLIISTAPGPKNDTSLKMTNISVVLNERSNDGRLSNSVKNSQQSGGWIVMENQTLISGKAETQQLLNYRDSSGCFVRSVGATGGRLLRDDSSTICPSLFRNMVNLLLNQFVGGD